MRDRSIYIVGAGGHGAVIADILVASGRVVRAFLDRAPSRDSIAGLPVITGTTLPEPDAAVIVAIGDNHTREVVAAQYQCFATAIHPSAVVASGVEIGEGSVVMAGAVVNPGVRIGRHCIVNTQSSVDHDCIIGDFAHIAPGAILGGNVTLGRGAFIGLGGRVIHGIRIGEATIVGAGATVVEDLPESVVAWGVPARVRHGRNASDRYL